MMLIVNKMSYLKMKRLLISLLCTAALAACSDSSEDINQKAEKLAEKAATKQVQASSSSAAELRPENIANYDEKVDVNKIGLALKKAGVDKGQQKEAEWNQRLAAAKTDADVKSVLREQLDMYRQGQQVLSGLEMSSEKGRTIHTHLLNGFAGTVATLEPLQNLDLSSAEGIVVMNETMPKIRQYGMEIVQGMKLWMDLMKANNQPMDAAAEARFQEKMKELEPKLK